MKHSPHCITVHYVSLGAYGLKEKARHRKRGYTLHNKPLHYPFFITLCVVILNDALFPTLCEISIILIQVTIR